MGICAFGWQNLILSGTVTADTQVASLPVTNLQTDQGAPSTAWRTISKNTSNLTLTLPAATPIQAISLHRTNLSATATWYITLSSGGTVVARYGASGANKPCNVANGQCIYVLPAAVSADTVLISIYEQNGNPDGYISIGLAYVGPIWQPARNMSTSTTYGSAALVDEVTSLSGVEYPQYRAQQRTVSIDHQSLGPDELPTLRALYATAWRGGNVLFVPDPASSAINGETIFGRLTPSDIGNGGPSRRNTKMTIKERL